jgi:hypothetical protein
VTRSSAIAYATIAPHPARRRSPRDAGAVTRSSAIAYATTTPRPARRRSARGRDSAAPRSSAIGAYATTAPRLVPYRSARGRRPRLDTLMSTHRRLPMRRRRRDLLVGDRRQHRRALLSVSTDTDGRPECGHCSAGSTTWLAVLPAHAAGG